MKKINAVYATRFLVTCTCLLNCKKSHEPLTIQLYDKPLATIQKSIAGKWKLHYGKGGICGSCIQSFDDTYWKFDFSSFTQINNNVIISDKSITWTRAVGSFTNGSLTYIMKCLDGPGHSNDYIVQRINNDTLILNDYTSDAVFYHLTKAR